MFGMFQFRSFAVPANSPRWQKYWDEQPYTQLNILGGWYFFITFGVSVLIEMEPVRRFWVWKHMHILQKYVFSPLSMQILAYHVHKSLKETPFF